MKKHCSKSVISLRINKLIRIALFFAVLFYVGIIQYDGNIAYADSVTNEELLKEIQVLKRRVTELEKKLGEQDKKEVEVDKVLHGAEREKRGSRLGEQIGKAIGSVEVDKVLHGVKRQEAEYRLGEGIKAEEAALSLGADATFILQGTPNANNAGSGEDSIFNASWSSDIEIQKVFEKWGLAFIHLEPGVGDTIESDLKLFSNVNVDANETGGNPDISEVWYEHYFFDKQIALTGGKLDFTVYFDQNEYVNDETTQFLAHIFRNSPVIEFPSDNTLGFHGYICMKPLQFIGLDVGYFNADASWKHVFDHGFYMAQVNFKPVELFGNVDKNQWGGNYRFYTWINDQNHEKLVKEAETASDKTKELNWGFGLSCDQKVTDVFGIFGRFGWQRPDIAMVDGSATLEWTWSVGTQMTGTYWNRENDVLAFAIGQVFPSKKWKDASSDNYGAGEGHIETYYKCQLNDCLAISPDLQVIWNPNGVDKSSQGDNDTIFVYGVRAQVDF